MIFLLGVFAMVELLVPPKQPDLKFEWRVSQVRGIDEFKIKSIYFRDTPRWVRLYGVEVPKAGRDGYSGSEFFLELILGRSGEVYFEDETKDHPIQRHAEYVQYLWTKGKLIQFEMVHEGWASVNDEGRKGRYGKFLTEAEQEAKHLKLGIWSKLK